MDEKIISILKEIIDKEYQWKNIKREPVVKDDLFIEFEADIKDEQKAKELENAVNKFFEEDKTKNIDYMKIYDKNTKEKFESIYVYNVKLIEEMESKLCTKKRNQAMLFLQNYGLVKDNIVLNTNMIIYKNTNNSYSIDLDIFVDTVKYSLDKFKDTNMNEHFKEITEFVKSL